MFDLEYHLKMLPDKPGVYLMKNSLGEVIYVGKAKNLKNRVRQYFQSSKNHTEKVKAMVKNIEEFEYIVTDSEMEALILECNLIKKHRPRYNILLKDDKHYPFIKITVKEDFPRVFMTRMVAKDGAKYFGPYPDAGAVHETLLLIKKLFPVRTCKKSIEEGKILGRPCLNYFIHQCKGPCAGYINKAEYGSIIDSIIELLSGKDTSLLRELKSEMETAAENLEFEKAASLRDKISNLEKIREKQKIIIGSQEDEDFINIFSDEKDSCVQVFYYRNGQLQGREHFVLEYTAGAEVPELIADFMKEFYGGTAFIPKNIYLPQVSDEELIEQWLTMRRGSKVYLKHPQKGEKKELLDLVAKNAAMTLEAFKLKLIQDRELQRVALNEITELLELDDIPQRMEAFDISNIQGVDSVGSMVVFEGGKPKTGDYRRFKIKTVKGANDYDSMREILTRRFSHGLEEIKSIQQRELYFSSGKFSVFPDLILMDGGRGQVNIALEVLKGFNIDIPVCGMVKDDKHRTRGLIYNNKELIIRPDSELMKLITRIQDEVHRFAITYHRTLRDKRVLHSILEDIPGVGDKRRKELLLRFGSIENIKRATLEELLSTPAIDEKTAKNIRKYFGNN